LYGKTGFSEQGNSTTIGETDFAPASYLYKNAILTLQEVYRQFITGLQQTGALEFVAVIAGIASVWFSRKGSLGPTQGLEKETPAGREGDPSRTKEGEYLGVSHRYFKYCHLHLSKFQRPLAGRGQCQYLLHHHELYVEAGFSWQRRVCWDETLRLTHAGVPCPPHKAIKGDPSRTKRCSYPVT